ncbi:MAG TPA: DUF58 domain-containing protein [Candidatus Obscuribacterales bacterium]
MVASGRLYALVAAGVVLFLLIYHDPAFAGYGLIYDVLLAALGAFDFLITQKPSKLSATRAVSDRLSIGRQNEVNIEVFNQGASRLSVKLRDHFPAGIESDVREFAFSMTANSRASLNYMLVPRKRGAYTFGAIKIRYASKLGLFWREVTMQAQREVKVYSDLLALRELSVRLSHSTELGDLRMRKRGHGTEFASLREYVSGDDSRNIDWKATARRERPVVRVYEVEQEQTLMVLVDAGRMMVSDLEGLTRFDHALNAALSLVLTGLYKGDQVGFGVFADKPLLFLPPRRGKAYLTRVLEAACDVQPRMVEPDYAGALSFFASAQKSRSLMVVLTDLTDPMGSQTLLAGLSSLSPRHLPFCVTLRDRQVENVAREPSFKTDAIYRRAVATDLIAQRELAFSQLQRRGCLVLDCPPQELSEKLVDRYLEIKARGQL